jgi:mevalonate pyrophosphate decarboxylase
MNLQKLFVHMASNHGVTLLETEMLEIIDIVKEITAGAQDADYKHLYKLMEL